MSELLGIAALTHTKLLPVTYHFPLHKEVADYAKYVEFIAVPREMYSSKKFYSFHNVHNCDD